MIFLAKVGVGLMGTVLVGSTMICSEGFIHVKVHEKKAGGTRLSLIVPAAIVPLTLRFVPDHRLAKASQQLRPVMPALDAAIPALEDSPDGVLVEVRDAEDHVLITKVGSSLIVDVNDRDDAVHVSVPLAAAAASLHEIAGAGGTI